jgi:glycerol dehydrogenase
MLTVFCAPARYTQGKDATASLGKEISGLGLTGPALLIAGKSAIKELTKTWKSTLGEANIAYKLYPFEGECSLSNIQATTHAAKSFNAKLIIVAGGGKAIDTARATAADLNLPIVVCPTVVATDAPTSALSVIYSDQGVFQQCRFYKRNPDLVLVDTQVVANAPVRLFIAGIGDALSTWFEARACAASGKSHSRGGASSQAALTLAKLCFDTILADGVAACAAVRAHVVTPQLERVAEANTLLSGLGFESSGLAAAHSIHNGLTAAHETHAFYHGEKVAFGVLTQLHLEKQPSHVITEVFNFCTSIGLPTHLAQIGIKKTTPALLAKIAARATAPTETIHNEPFAVTPELVISAILAADTLGKSLTR